MGGETLWKGGTVPVAVSLLRAVLTPPVNASADYKAQWSRTTNTGWLKKKFSLPRTEKLGRRRRRRRMPCGEWFAFTVWQSESEQLGARAGTRCAVQSQEQREQGVEISSQEVKQHDCVCSTRTQHGCQSSQRSCSLSAGADGLCGFNLLWPHRVCSSMDYALSSRDFLVFIIVSMTKRSWVTSTIKVFMVLISCCKNIQKCAT